MLKIFGPQSASPARVGPGGDQQVVAEEEALPDGLPLLLHHGEPAPGPRPGFLRQDLQQGSLPDEHLVHVQQDVAALHDHPLYCQILPDVLRLGHLVVHLAGEVLQLDPGLLQGVLLHVVGRGVGQQLVQGDDVARDLRVQLSISRGQGQGLYNLVHWVSQEGGQGMSFTGGLLFQTVQKIDKPRQERETNSQSFTLLISNFMNQDLFFGDSINHFLY